MKQGKCPTKDQKVLLKKLGFNFKDWLISKNTPVELVIVCRYTGQCKRISKEYIKEAAL